MKVLHAIPSLDPATGGPASAIEGLAKAQHAAGLDVRVLATRQPTDGPEIEQRLREAGVPVRVLDAHGKLYRSPLLACVVREMVADADVVHAHGLWEDMQHFAAGAARAAGKPYFIRPAGMLCPWAFSARGRWKKRLYLLWRLRRDLDRATAIHYTSDMERDLSVRLHHLTTPSLVVPNGVNPAEFATLPPRGTFRARHPEIGDRLMLLFLSRLSEQKGLDILIPAFASGAPRDAVLVVAGPDYGVLEMARRLTTEHGVQDRVIFTGMLKGAERIAAFADADLFVLPSRHENFGNVVVESLAAGVPVAISDQVYIHSFITRAGVGGVSPLSVDAYAELLRRWTSDDALRESARARARAFVFEEFAWTGIAKRWAEIYQRVVDKVPVAEVVA